MIIMTLDERLVELHDSGCNCCQSLLVACGPELGLTEDQAYRLGTYFGGGMRRPHTSSPVTGAPARGKGPAIPLS